MSGRGRESRASSEATVCLMSINAAPTFIFNLCLFLASSFDFRARFLERSLLSFATSTARVLA